MKNLTIHLVLLLVARVTFGQGVGIGTNTPDPSAAVEVSSVTQGMLVPRMTTTQREMIASPAAGLLVFDITTNTFWFRDDSSWTELITGNDIEVHRNGPDMIYMGTTDSVGIGTMTPGHKLQVKTGSNRYGISHTNGSVDLVTWVGVGGEIGTRSQHNFYLYAGDGTGQFMLKPNGNIGINLLDTENRLDIAGNNSRNGVHATGRPLYITGDMSAGSNGIEFRHTNATQGIGFGFNTIYATGNNADQDLGLAARGAGGHVLFSTNAAERMRITGEGRIGIGTNTPGATLEIVRGTAPFGALQINGTNYNSHFNYGTPDDTYLRGGKPGAKVIINDFGDLGNVGIGTDNPLQKLHVNGKMYLTNNLGIGHADAHVPLQFSNALENRKIVLYEGGNNDNQYYGFGINGGVLRYQAIGDHVFYYGANATTSNELIRIKSDGRLGVGVSAPDATVEIARGSAPFGALLIRGTNFYSHFNYGTPEDTYIRGGKPGAKVIINDYAELGNVGIGTASPLQKLHVNGNMYLTNNLGIGQTDAHAPLQFSNALENRKIVLYEAVNNDHQYFGLGINGSTLRYQVSTTSDNHTFYAGTSATTSNELMRIRGNGNVDVAGALEIGYVQVNSGPVSIPGLSWGSATCNCPEGTVVISGGFNWNVNIGEMNKSYPSSSTSWYASAYNADITSHNLTAYAICARLAN